ncbi:MAG: hypothetical protein ABJC07_04380 [Acidobacteriota bacterium]
MKDDRGPAAFLREWGPELTLILVTTAAGVWAAGRWIDPTGDPGVWWSIAYRMARGERCYRDIFLQYGPLSPYLLLVTGRPFGFSRLWFLLVNWIPAVAAALLILRAARPFFTVIERLALVGLLIRFALFAPRPARMVLPYSPAAVLGLCFGISVFLLLSSRGGGSKSAYGAGILAGLALCTKQEVGVAAILGLCAPLVVEGRRGIPRVFRCVAGFLLVAAVGAGVVLSSGASLDSLRNDSHLWPLASVPSEWHGLFRAIAGIDTAGWRSFLWLAALALLKAVLLVALLALCLGREKSVRRWGLTLLPLGLVVFLDLVNGRDWLPKSVPLALSMTVAFLAGLLAWLERRQKGRDFLVGFALFAGLVGVRTAFSWDLSSPYSGVTHLAACVTWMIFLLVLVPARIPGGASPVPWARAAWLVVFLALGWPGAIERIADLRETERVSLRTPRGSIFPDARFAAAYARIGNELHAGERALFLPETHALDVLYGAVDASPLLGHLPGWLDSRAEDTLLRRFEASPPAVVVLFDRPTREFGVRPFGRGYGLKLAAWIDRRYAPVEAFPALTILRLRKNPLSSSPTH